MHFEVKFVIISGNTIFGQNQSEIYFWRKCQENQINGEGNVMKCTSNATIQLELGLFEILKYQVECK